MSEQLGNAPGCPEGVVWLAQWVNHLIADFFGDFPDERKPERNPSPYRAVIRIICLAILVIVFVGTLFHYFLESPEVVVEQIQQLRPGEKNHNYPIHSLYDRNSIASPSGSYNESYGGREGVRSNSSRPPLSCPCSTTGVQWRNYVSFYALTVNSSEWAISWEQDCPSSFGASQTAPCIYVPPRNDYYVNLLKSHIVVDPKRLNGNPGSNQICDTSTLWNVTNNKFQWVLGEHTYVVCYWLASMLFPPSGTSVQYGEGKSTETTSTDILETPMLLDRETFFMRVAELSREAVVKRRLRVSEFHAIASNFQTYHDGIADYLVEVLDRGELDEYWQSFYEGAYYLQETGNVSMAYASNSAMVVFVGYSATNPVFLHAQVNWTQYYMTCAPMYCERTKTLKGYERLIRAFAIVGGLSTFMIAIATMIMWPAVALLIYLLCNRSSGSQIDFSPRSHLYGSGTL